MLGRWYVEVSLSQSSPQPVNGRTAELVRTAYVVSTQQRLLCLRTTLPNDTDEVCAVIIVRIEFALVGIYDGVADPPG